MRYLFVGPSLYGVDFDHDNLVVCAPAAQGDVFRAVQAGATHIGLIDGIFGDAGSVWHKELLYALSKGVVVFGASSMGALRAAECAPFGVVPVGRIAHLYLNGHLDDDAAVALSHAPAEFGFQPFTIPLVDVISTIEAVAEAGLCSGDQAAAAINIASKLHFSERTEEALEESFRANCAAGFAHHFRQLGRSQKALDAMELVATLQAVGGGREMPTWAFSEGPLWKTFRSTHA